MGSVVSLMVVHSYHTVSQDDYGHLENGACDAWLLQGLLFVPKLFCGNVPWKPVGAQLLPQPLKSFVLIL